MLQDGRCGLDAAAAAAAAAQAGVVRGRVGQGVWQARHTLVLGPEQLELDRVDWLDGGSSSSTSSCRCGGRGCEEAGGTHGQSMDTGARSWAGQGQQQRQQVGPRVYAGSCEAACLIAAPKLTGAVPLLLLLLLCRPVWCTGSGSVCYSTGALQCPSCQTQPRSRLSGQQQRQQIWTAGCIRLTWPAGQC